MGYKTAFLDLFELEYDSIADVELTVFNLSKRTINCFYNKRIYSLKDLLNYSEYDLLSIKNFGRKSFEEVKTKILNKEVLNNFSIKPKAKGLNKSSETLKLVCPPIIKENIESIIKKDLSSINVGILNTNELIYFNKLKEALDIVDTTLVLDAYYNPNKIIDITNMFHNYHSNTNEKIKINNEIKNLLSKIPEYRHSTYFKNYIKAFSNAKNNQDLINFLIENKAANIFVKDISLLVKKFIDYNDIYLRFVFLLKHMDFDINEMVSSFFSGLYKNDYSRLQKVLSLRSENKTLDFVGTEIGLTRERVRQIESKAQRKFNLWIGSHNIILLVAAINNIGDVITPNNISNEISEHCKEVLYMLKKSESKYYVYDNKLDVFIISSDDIKLKAEEYVDSLPDNFSDIQYDKFIDDAIKNNISKELVKRIINEQFKHTGSVYHRSTLTLSSIYKTIMEKYYPNGMKIYDNEEIKNFKQKIYSNYGNIKLPENSRAIIARIADLAITCDRGTYMPKRQHYISDILAKDIYNYVLNNKRSTLLTNTIFNVFKERLTSEGVINKYYLQGILRELYGDRFMYKRDYIINNNANDEGNIYNEVTKYIEDHRSPVSYNVIASKFPGITNVIVSFAVSEPEIINLYGKYIHRSRLNLNFDYLLFLRSTLKKLLADGEIHHAKEIYEVVNSYRPDIWLNLYVEYSFGAFSILEALFGNEFEFKRPYIARKGVKIEHATLGTADSSYSFVSDVEKEKIIKIIVTRFKNGYRNSSSIDFERFKNYYVDEYDEEFEYDVDWLNASISAKAFVYDGRAYIFDKDVVEHVRSYLEQIDSPCIFIGYFFNKYYSSFYTFGIFSVDILRAFIEKYYKDISVKWDYIYMKDNVSTYELIKEVFSECETWTFDELHKRLPYLKMSTIRQIMNSAEYFRVDKGTYTHIDNIELPDAEGKKIRMFVENKLFDRDYITANELDLSKFVDLNPHCSFYAVRDAVYYKFLSDGFDKNGQIITRAGVKLRVLDIIEQYCREADFVSLRELNELEATFDPDGRSHSLCLIAGNNTMIRVSGELFVADHNVDFDVEKIDDVLALYCNDSFIPLRGVTDFSLFPFAGHTWNLFMLESFVRRFSNSFKFDVRAVNSANIGVIVKKSFNYNNYDDILALALAKSFVCLSDKKAVADYLFENGYIGWRNLGKSEGAIIKGAEALKEGGTL